MKLLEHVVLSHNEWSARRSALLDDAPELAEALEMETEEQFEAWWGTRRFTPNRVFELARRRHLANDIQRQRQWLQCVKLTRSQPKVIHLRYTLSSPSRPDDMVPRVVDALVEG
ncbi:MAG TPA: hypothetical protein VGB96_02785, partial [Archangium sp.]